MTETALIKISKGNKTRSLKLHIGHIHSDRKNETWEDLKVMGRAM